MLRFLSIGIASAGVESFWTCVEEGTCVILPRKCDDLKTSIEGEGEVVFCAKMKEDGGISFPRESDLFVIRNNQQLEVVQIPRKGNVGYLWREYHKTAVPTDAFNAIFLGQLAFLEEFACLAEIPAFSQAGRDHEDLEGRPFFLELSDVAATKKGKAKGVRYGPYDKLYKLSPTKKDPLIGVYRGEINVINVNKKVKGLKSFLGRGNKSPAVKKYELGKFGSFWFSSISSGSRVGLVSSDPWTIDKIEADFKAYVLEQRHQEEDRLNRLF